MDNRILEAAANTTEDQPANANGATLVGDAMTFGVSTVRPGEDVSALTERMRSADVGAVLVTSSDAHLLGVLIRAQAEGLVVEC